MHPKPINTAQLGFYSTLEEQLNHHHPLYILAGQINWSFFDTTFLPLYHSQTGRPAKSIRLMVSLLILKHIRNLSDVSVDTTVQEKNITYPTDDKLNKKIIAKCQAMAAKEQLPVRQSYTRTLKKLSVGQRFRNHPKNKSKARKADRKVKTIAGRLVRELERNLLSDSKFQTELELFKKYSRKKETTAIKFIPCMSRMYIVSQKAKSIKNMSLAIKFLLYKHKLLV